MNRILEGLARSSGSDSDDDLSGTRLKFGCLCARGRLCRCGRRLEAGDCG